MGKQRSNMYKGSLTEKEVEDRIYKQIQIIEDEANKEINMMSIQTADSSEISSKQIANEPKELIDEWVEKVRAYTERGTMIQAARLRRIAKLRVLEAFGNIREVIKEEARERIKEKMMGDSDECDELIGRMLYQGLIRLMESTVLVHTTRIDIKKVEKHYAWVSKKYQEETNVKLKLVTSKHPLKSSYYGRIVLSDKKSTVFVDVNLHKNVDKIADTVFTHEAAVHGKYKNPLHLEIKNLRAHGFKIMPRGNNITNARLDILISTMHGDPRTQMPNICLIEESKKQLVDTQEPVGVTLSKTNKRKVTIPYITPAPAGGGGPTEPVMSVIPAKYMFRQAGQEETSTDELSRGTRDLYNLENEASSMELSSHIDVPPGGGQSAVWKNMTTPRMKSMAKSRPSKAMPRFIPRKESSSVPEKKVEIADDPRRDTISNSTNQSPRSSTADTESEQTTSRPSDESGTTAESGVVDESILSRSSLPDPTKENNYSRK
ncbi:hypothetical protein GE061_011407 [Apolygus lucorum]|uniref:Uncharacterized protein n=1 Tax=Apolygus lucorum TaxID=248454 RepID=A0A6A4JZ25_APOLU|nr:hypothetical protein GE061_011407 [Apolygus lucorum]